MSEIKIVEKPDWVSWETIHEVLVAGHAENRSKGVVMAYSVQPAKKIAEICKDGVMFVALDGEKVVGTGAVILQKEHRWYYKGAAAFEVFAAVLPEYKGRGIYKLLSNARKAKVIEKGIPVIISLTHEKNYRILEIAKQLGAKFVQLRAAQDHYNIIFVRYLNGCPFPDWYISLMFNGSKILYKLRYRIDKDKGRVKRFGI